MCIIILLLEKFEDEYLGALLLRSPWQDVTVKASGSCGLERTSRNISMLLCVIDMLFDMSCSVSLTCQGYKGDCEGYIRK